MEHDFGVALRTLRKQKALSQSALAERSGLALRTVSYWEAGQLLPRIPEFQAALQGMKATPEEAGPLLELLNAPRGLRFTETLRAEETAALLPGMAPGIGDLLRAMRARRGIKQHELAEQMRVSRRAVLRWESGENAITSENLERLCVLLGAAPEERSALRDNRLLLPQWENRDWRKITTEEAAHLWRGSLQCQERMVEDYNPPSSLFDLYALAMKRHLYLHVTPDFGARELLGKIETDHAVWLYYNDRDAQAGENTKRVMQLISGQKAPQDYWATALNLNVSFAQTDQHNMVGSLRTLAQWIPRLPPGCVRTQQLCDMAVYTAAETNDRGKSLALIEEAERSMNRAGGPLAPEVFYCKTASERVRLMTDKVSEISATLLTQCANNFQRIHLALLWTAQLGRRGEKDAARSYLAMALEWATPDLPARLRRKVHEALTAY